MVKQCINKYIEDDKYNCHFQCFPFELSGFQKYAFRQSGVASYAYWVAQPCSSRYLFHRRTPSNFLHVCPWTRMAWASWVHSSCHCCCMLHFTITRKARARRQYIHKFIRFVPRTPWWRCSSPPCTPSRCCKSSRRIITKGPGRRMGKCQNTST